MPGERQKKCRKHGLGEDASRLVFHPSNVSANRRFCPVRDAQHDRTDSNRRRGPRLR